MKDKQLIDIKLIIQHTLERKCSRIPLGFKNVEHSGTGKKRARKEGYRKKCVVHKIYVNAYTVQYRQNYCDDRHMQQSLRA